MGEISDGQPLFPGESEVDQLYIGKCFKGRREKPFKLVIQSVWEMGLYCVGIG